MAMLVALTGCTTTPEAAFDRDEFQTLLQQARTDHADLTDITHRLARDCMEDQGFMVHPINREAAPQATPTPADSDDIEIVMQARYMYQSDTIAETGYGASPFEELGFVPGSHQDPTTDDPFGELPPEEQADYWLAYDGDYLPRNPDGGDHADTSADTVTVDGREYRYPTTGCFAEILDDIHEGTYAEYLRLTHFATEGLAYVAYGDFHNDPGVQDALEDWSDCMADAGHPDLESPDDAVQLARDLYRDADVFGPQDDGFTEVKDQEIAIAHTDYDCNTDVALDERQVDIFWTLLEPYALERETEIYGWRTHTEDALHRAQNLLSV